MSIEAIVWCACVWCLCLRCGCEVVGATLDRPHDFDGSLEQGWRPMQELGKVYLFAIGGDWKLRDWVGRMQRRPRLRLRVIEL